MKPLIVVLAFASQVFAQTGSAPEHWVSTWATSPQQPRAFPRPPAPPANANATATPAAPTAAPARPAPPRFVTIASFHNQTIRMVARTTIAGRRVRVELSNAFGSTPLVIGAAHVAIRDKESDIVPASDRTLLFGGRPTSWIPPGATEVSDAVNLDVSAGTDLAVSIFVPQEVKADTMHAVGLHTTYVSDGDLTGKVAIPDSTGNPQSYYWLSNIDVAASADAAAIVTFGDSITDGATSSPNTDRSWPSFLARRLAAAGANIAVLNQGISGNRLLRDGAGINALARFDRDVLTQPGVKWMTILEGINDIGLGSRADTPVSDAVSADELIAAQKQLIDRAHMHGIKVIGCTLTPYEGAAYYSEGGEQIRTQVNQWIRTSGAFDAVVDFDAVTRDPENPKRIRASFNDVDHLHPNDAGYEAMANAIDLTLFGVKASASASK